MMRIETSLKNNYGLPVLYLDGIKIQYDKNGIAEVDEKIGKTLLKHYPEFIYKEGQVPKPEVPKIETPPQENDEQINELTNKLVKKEQAIAMLKQKVVTLTSTLDDWKNSYNTLKDENDALKGNANAPKEEIEEKEEPKEEISIDPNAELRTSLESEVKADLQEMAAGLEKPRSEWGNLNKADLIEYLIENTKD